MEFIDGRSIVMGRGIAASLSDGKYHVKSEIRYTMLLSFSLSLCFSSRWGEVTKLRGDDNRFLPAEVYRFTSCCSFLPLFHSIAFVVLFIIRCYKSAQTPVSDFFLSLSRFLNKNIDVALYLIVTPCDPYSMFSLFRKIINRK